MKALLKLFKKMKNAFFTLKVLFVIKGTVIQIQKLLINESFTFFKNILEVSHSNYL